MAPVLEKLDIAVLCGGRGGEREVSLVSGEEVNRGLRESGLLSRIIALSVDCAELESLECDVAFIALHGEFGEDGQIQQILQDRKIVYTGSGVVASALAMDKYESKKFAAAAGIPVARSVCEADSVKLLDAFERCGVNLPVVVKPNNGGSSVGVTIVRDNAHLASAVTQAFGCGQKVMIEEFLAGREVTVGIVGDTALPLVEMCPASEFYDYHAKYNDERTKYTCPAECSDDISSLCQDYALRAFKALGLRDMARIDFIITDKGPYMLEGNSIPGFTSHSLLPKAAGVHGIAFPELCRSIVRMACERSAVSAGGGC